MGLIDIIDPYPDQLFFDMCASYGEMMLYSQTAVKQALFGRGCRRVATDFPCRIATFSDRIAVSNGYTADYFIDSHTLFPLYHPFLTIGRASSIRTLMLGARSHISYAQLGLGMSGIAPPPYLRFCPICVREDRVEHDGCFWRRSHQLPGLDVCAVHSCYLEDSAVTAHDAGHLISAEYGVPEHMPPVRLLNPLDADEAVLITLTRDAAWLLEHQQGISLQGVRQRYLYLLAERGWASYSGTLYTKKLTAVFSQRYSPHLLKKLGCQIKGWNKRNWLARWLEKDRVNHPLRHLLMILLLEYTVADFFNLPENMEPFGAAPWPCLNPVCVHYRQPVIEDIVLGYSRKRRRRPLGTFTCLTCGFSYCRAGPDKSAEDRYRIGRMRHFGPVWEDRLRQLYVEHSGNAHAISRELGCYWETAQRHARRLGLGGNPIVQDTSLASGTGRRYSELPTPDTIASYRDAWLDALREHPRAGMAALQRLVTETYNWLDRHDSHWLQGHKPLPKIVHKSETDWEKRDRQVSSDLFSTVHHIRSQENPQRRITINIIARSMGYADSCFRRDLNKLPRTQGVLPYLLESKEAFVLRRLQTVFEFHRKQENGLSRSQIIKRAGISRSMQTARVNEAIQLIHHQLMQRQYE